MKQQLLKTISRFFSVVLILFVSTGLFAQVNLLTDGGFELGQSSGTYSSSATYGAAWTANGVYTALLGIPT